MLDANGGMQLKAYNIDADGFVTVLRRCHSCDTQKQPLGDVFELQVFESNSPVRKRVRQMTGCDEDRQVHTGTWHKNRSVLNSIHIFEMIL